MTKKYYSKVAAALLLLTASSAGAGDGMALPLGHAELLRFTKPAHRVILGNPQVADVNLDTPALMTVVGRSVGSTNLIVLGEDDKPIFSAHIAVVPTASGSVEVHVPGVGPAGPDTRVYDCGGGRCAELSAAVAVTK